MYEETRHRKANLGYSWVKSAGTGATFLCPTRDIANLRTASESELRSVCVDESNNPQND